jgi:hypothetical protein
MADTTFVSKVTNIVVAWAQAVNNFIYRGRSPLFVTSTGSADAYVITLPATSLVTSLAAGDAFSWKANFTSAGTTPTLTVVGGSSLGPYTMINNDGSALSAAAITSGGIYRVLFDGTNMQMDSPAVADLTGVAMLADNNPFDTGATDGTAIDIGFGAGWAANNRFLKTITATHTDAQAAVGIRFETTGSGTTTPGVPTNTRADYAAFIAVNKTNYRSSTVEGDINGPHVQLFQGRNGDAGGITIAVDKVYTGAGSDSGGTVGLESSVRSVNASGAATQVLQSVQGYGNGPNGESGKQGIGFSAETFQGTPYTGLYVGDYSYGALSWVGAWQNVLVASHSRSSADEYFKINNLGNLAKFGGQIVFPATQSSYQEGTWLPIITAGTPGNLSVAYGNQYGFYTKVGRLVTLSFVLTTTTFTHNTASGNARITGVDTGSGSALPFPILSTTGYTAQGTLKYSGLTMDATSFTIDLNSGNAYMLITGCKSTYGTQTAAITDFPSGGAGVVLNGTITYMTET